MSTGRYPTLLLTFVLAAAGSPGAWQRAAAADSLSQLRSDVRTPDPPQKPEPDQNNDQDESSDCDDEDYWNDEDGEATAGLLGLAALGASYIATSPIWGPQIMVGDGYRYPGYFPEYPYQYERGYMMVDYVDLFDRGNEREKYPWAWRARPDYGTNFSGLEWIGGNVLYETTPRIGAETDFRFLTEELPLGGYDDLWLGDANVFWRFAQSDQTQMRAGAGFNWLSDREHSDFGFNFTYAIDWYPVQPLVISAEMDLGNLNEAWLFHIRTTAGVTWRGLEAFAGYDLYDIDHFQAQGLVAGVRLWF